MNELPQALAPIGYPIWSVGVFLFALTGIHILCQINFQQSVN